MIGQIELKDRLTNFILADTLPVFTIIIGAKGSGRKTLLREILKNTGCRYVESGIKIDEIRELIHNMYKIQSKTYYIISNAGDMSTAAKNALLKLAEEPPHRAHLIMTLEDINNTLDTIRSRAVIFYMNNYTSAEITEYIKCRHGNISDGDIKVIKELCEIPGDVDILLNCGPQSFYDYAQLIIDRVADAPIANALKISEKIALKDNTGGYDLKLLLKAIAAILLQRAKQRGNSVELVKYCDAYSVTNKYLTQLRIKGINKQMLIDNWIIDMRGIL